MTETSIRDAREDAAEQFVRAYELSWDATLADIAGAKLDTFVPLETRIESFPGAWGTGIAPQLMRAALSAMRERGAEEAFLWVVEENGRARRFYERQGWIADGELRDSSMGPREVRYRLELGD